MSVALEAASSSEACLEHERKLEVLRTSLSSIEAAISRFKNIIKECRMMEEEVCQSLEEMASQDQPDSNEDVEMADEMVPRPESSDPPTEVDTGDQTMSTLGGVTVSPEEEEILMGSMP